MKIMQSALPSAINRHGKLSQNLVHDSLNASTFSKTIAEWKRHKTISPSEPLENHRNKPDSTDKQQPHGFSTCMSKPHTRKKLIRFHLFSTAKGWPTKGSLTRFLLNALWPRLSLRLSFKINPSDCTCWVPVRSGMRVSNWL